MLKNFSLLSCGVSLLLIAGCNSSSSTAPSGSPSTSGTPANGKLTIAVIPKGTTHVYWKSMEAGARKAGNELGATIVFKGPVKESDRAQQISIVEQFVTDGTSAIVLAPLDETALVKPVRNAKAKKIPVVIIDSALKGKAGEDFVSFVATNNFQGGVLAGEQMVKLLGGKGKVAVLRYQEGSAATIDREEGFLSVIKKNPGITVLVSNRFGGATVGEAKNTALNLVDPLRAADGVFASNESSSSGMLLALRQIGVAGKVKFVGFDSAPLLVEGLRKGDIEALIVQNPAKMGYEGVKAAVAAIKGEKVATSIDTGAAVVTKENLDTPEIKALLH
jgi:ribose transport system substrate-binding protein